MHRALRVRLAAMAAERPVVLVLDDLHWADDASLEAIAALMRRGPPRPSCSPARSARRRRRRC